jgi:hypothetical protein
VIFKEGHGWGCFSLTLYRSAVGLALSYDATSLILTFAIGDSIMPLVSEMVPSAIYPLRSRDFHDLVTPTLMFLLMTVSFFPLLSFYSDLLSEPSVASTVVNDIVIIIILPHSPDDMLPFH